ncbi:MAG: hypothetical protein DRJ15_01690 [Bacteroidetes bacterium]|nr:MAG: hypothetical protein DRJ15_01690 [Bacteroidota bacterium]
MKKSFLLLFTLLLFGFSFLQAQDIITVSGTVTNELNGDPVANHDVNIMLNDSTVYSSTVATNLNGFYMDTINTMGISVTSIYIFTNDLCTYGIHDTLIQSPGSQVYADFEICVDSTPGSECQADFYYIDDSLANLTVQFFDQSTSVNPITSWSWSFGDGTGSGEQYPVHTYGSAGTYNVCLTIESEYAGAMCTDTYCMDVVVQNGGGNDCFADFYYTIDSVGGDYTVIHFYDLSTPLGSIDSWYWDFGDGNTSTEQNPVHAYNISGYADVCLTITSDSGSCTSTECMIVQLPGGGGDCQADFYYIEDSTANLTVHFFDQSISANPITSWSWSFGDGSGSAEQNPVHTFNASGEYYVCLTITADSGFCTSTYCELVYVQLEDDLYLGGNVFADIYQLDHGFAYAYKEENGVITDVYSEMIDTLGYYLFYPMAEAGYYVKAEPSPSSSYFSTYMPTYYGDVASWADAILINLDDNLYTADINLIPVVQTVSGPGMIAGNITHGTAEKANTPAVDVQIMLANEQGEFVGLTYSDDEGKFEFTSLPIETYALFAEVTGINMTPKDFSLTDNTPEINDISMIMNSEEIYFGPNGIESIYIDDVSNVYPNPISNKLKLDIGIKNPTKITVKIYNQMGQLLIMDQFSMGSTQTLEVNTSELHSGMYFLEIIADDNYRVARKFIKQ